MSVSTLSNLVFRSATQGDFTVSAEAPKGFYVDFPTMLSSIMNVVLTVAVIAVLLYLIWGGIEWITSGGDKGKTESARNKITSAVIGLVILISAWAIMLFVQQLLGVNVFGGKSGANTTGDGMPASPTTCAAPGSCVPTSNCTKYGGTVISGTCSSGRVCCRDS